MWDKIFSTADALQKGLSASWTRNAVIRNNLANAETPGFKAGDLEFETLLADAVERAAGSGFDFKQTRAKHIDIGGGIRFEDVEPALVTRRDLSMRMDENNVDVEAENVKLAQNSLYYNTLMEKLNADLNRIRMAINEGK